MTMLAWALQQRFLRFALVGGLGFVVDAGILSLLIEIFAANPYAARIVSILAAITVTWWCNRHFTFRSTQPAQHGEWLRYAALMLVGASVNYGVYALGVAYLPIAAITWRALAALCIATLTAMLVNYNSMRLFVFKAE